MSRIDRVAELPLPVRGHLGRELAADLEGAYAALLARGLPHEHALARARAMVLPDEAALTRLVHVHRPLYPTLVARFSPTATRRGERMALVGVAATALVLLAAGLSRAHVLVSPSRFLWPVLAVGAAILAAVAAKVFHLFVKRDHAPERLRVGLAWPLGLAVVAILTGLAGALVDTYRFAAALTVAPPVTPVALFTFIGSTAALLAIAFGLALAGALGWFLLLHWVNHAEAMAARDPLPEIVS